MLVCQSVSVCLHSQQQKLEVGSKDLRVVFLRTSVRRSEAIWSKNTFYPFVSTTHQSKCHYKPHHLSLLPQFIVVHIFNFGQKTWMKIHNKNGQAPHVSGQHVYIHSTLANINVISMMHVTDSKNKYRNRICNQMKLLISEKPDGFQGALVAKNQH